MPACDTTRRAFLGAGSAAAALFSGGLALPALPARAQPLLPTPGMRGAANNHRPGAPVVERIGGGGFWMTGRVRRAGDGAPLEGIRLQIWAHTTEGHERDPRSHGATLTGADGRFALEIPPILPAFGQPHGHLAYEGGAYAPLFLRPLLQDPRALRLDTHLVLRPL
jgi:hypothetical protein